MLRHLKGEVTETLELSTYYPAPYGEYDELSAENLIANKVSVGSYPLPTCDGTMLIEGNVGIGTTTPGAKLEVAGQIKITGGSPGAGKVLTSGASGEASWQLPPEGALKTLPIPASAISIGGSWSTSPTNLSNIVDNNLGTFSGGQATNSGLAYFEIDLGKIYKGLLFVKIGGWSGAGGQKSNFRIWDSLDNVKWNERWLDEKWDGAAETVWLPTVVFWVAN